MTKFKIDDAVRKHMKNLSSTMFSVHSTGTFTLDDAPPKKLTTDNLNAAIDAALAKKLAFILTNFDEIVDQFIMDNISQIILTAMGISVNTWGEIKLEKDGAVMSSLSKRVGVKMAEYVANDPEIDAVINNAMTEINKKTVEAVSSQLSYELSHKMRARVEREMSVSVEKTIGELFRSKDSNERHFDIQHMLHTNLHIAQAENLKQEEAKERAARDDAARRHRARMNAEKNVRVDNDTMTAEFEDDSNDYFPHDAENEDDGQF